MVTSTEKVGAAPRARLVQLTGQWNELVQHCVDVLKQQGSSLAVQLLCSHLLVTTAAGSPF